MTGGRFKDIRISVSEIPQRHSELDGKDPVLLAAPLLMLRLFLVVLLLVLLPAGGSAAPAFAGGGPRRRPEVVTSRRGAVAADDGRCSGIGRDVLREGGTAVDAAVAAALCLGVVSPASSGIGGGAFMLVRTAKGVTQAFDMRETAPLKAHKDMYNGNTSLKASGPLSVGIPGELAGLHLAWKQHGKLPWKRLVAPAARLARSGFRISAYLYMQMNRTRSGILADKGLREVFARNGSLLQVGQVCIDEKLAETLEAVADYGPEVFYRGALGVKLVRDLEEAGGIVTMDDLMGYKVKVKEPVVAELMGVQVLGMPPPSSGGAGLVLVSNILAQYGFPWGISGSLGAHRLIESLKHLFAVRMNLGDPDFVNVTNVLSDMLSINFARELKAAIYDNRTFPPKHYGGKWNQMQDHGTSHLCIVDQERNSVSMTSTINSYFGALLRSPSTGIVLNNEMDDFSIPTNNSESGPPPAPANFIHPLKRPLSSMTPTIVVKDGQMKAVIGASGGAFIIAGTTEVFLNYFARGMDPFSSVMAPRLYHQLIPNVVMYENWTTVTGDHFEISPEVRADLKSKGHILQGIATGTICQLIVDKLDKQKAHTRVNMGELTAVSDPRKGGIPAGY